MAHKSNQSIDELFLHLDESTERSLTPAQKEILEKAIIKFDEAIAVTPSDADAWYGKAITLYKLGFPARAEECLREAKCLIRKEKS
jgi:tetratricopeptide (TPR) repeat protein